MDKTRSPCLVEGGRSASSPDASRIPCAEGFNGRVSAQRAAGCFPHSLPWARRGSSESPPRDAVEMSQQRHLHVK